MHKSMGKNMIISKIQKDSDGEFFFEIPESEINRLNLVAGDTIRMDLKRIPTPSENPEEFQRYVDMGIEGADEMLEELRRRES